MNHLLTGAGFPPSTVALLSLPNRSLIIPEHYSKQTKHVFLQKKY